MSINGWMDKLNVEYPYNGILFSSEKDEILINATCMNLNNIMVSQRSQAQKGYTVCFHLCETLEKTI